MNLLKKAIAAICAVAMLATFAVVPVMAEDIQPNITNFEATANTTWVTKENNGGGTVSNTGDTITMSTTNGGIVQVRPANCTSTNIGAMNVVLTKGFTYTVSIHYKANITAFTNDSNQNVVYATAYALGGNNGTTVLGELKNKTGITGKSSDTPNANGYSGYITGTFTPTENSKLELQLYLRHCQGSVTFSNITVTGPAPVAIGSVGYSTLSDAVTAATTGNEIKIYGDVSFSNRIDINKEVTITGFGEMPTLSGAIEMQNGQGGNVTTSNIKYTNFNATNQTLTATNCEFTDLRVGGNSGDSKRIKLTDCTVDSLSTYGYVNLLGATTVNNLTVSGISVNKENNVPISLNNSGSDRPKINVSATTSVGGMITFNTSNFSDTVMNLCVDNGYDLVDGAAQNFSHTWNNSGYTITSDGIITNAINAKINAANYATLTDADAAAKDGDTVVLLNDYSGDLVCDKKDCVIDLNTHTLNGKIYIKFNNHITVKNGTVSAVQLETGTGAQTYGTSRNTITVEDATVINQITTDASRLEEKRTNENDVNRNGIIVKGNSTLTGGVKIVSATQNSSILDTLDVSEYTNSSPIAVTIPTALYFTAGTVFFTGDASKVTLTGVDDYELSNGALVTKSAPAPEYTEINSDNNVYTAGDISETEKGFAADLGNGYTDATTVNIEWKVINLKDGENFRFTTFTQTINPAQNGTKFGIALKNIQSGDDYKAMWFVNNQ